MSKGPSQVGMVNHQAGQKKHLNEAKMLLVGQTGVGKTSLAKLLQGGKFNPHEENSKGIGQITVNVQKVRLNVWDFGKDDIRYATYRFFLTKRSLYLLVLNTRLDGAEKQIEDWLKIIKRFGRDSPVIIVGNKIDEQPLYIDKQRLNDNYKNIKDFVEISYGTGNGFDELKNVIAREVSLLECSLLEHIHDPLPTTWPAVKTLLEEMDKDHISYQEYLVICQTEGVTDDPSQRALLHLLHDLGTILNFQDDLELKQTIILKPEWITNGVYKILNSNELFQRNGVLEREMLNRVLDSREYPSDSHLFIMNMMDKFELCFEFEGSHHRRFLIPDLLSKQEPYTGEWNDALTFQYHYDVFPGSIISRFIVLMHPSICKDTYWRSGVVLEDVDGRNKALVKADRGGKKIFIWVSGREQTRRDFLGTIRSSFKHIHETIHETIPGIKPEEKVPLPDHPEIVVDYRHLLVLEDLGEKNIIPEGLKKRYPVKQLLNGVEPEKERRERREEDGMNKRDSTSRSPPPQPIPENTPTNKPANLWITGTFYLVAVAFAMALIAVISKNVSWYALPAVIIGGIMIIVLIAILQLLLTGKLSQDNFVTLIREILKHLHLLKK